MTKLLTAYAALIAVEEGALGLDDSAGPPESTIRHLLAHASGVAPDARTVVAKVGTRRIYSNAGFEILADAVEAATGMPFAVYLGAGCWSRSACRARNSPDRPLLALDRASPTCGASL